MPDDSSSKEKETGNSEEKNCKSDEKPNDPCEKIETYNEVQRNIHHKHKEKIAKFITDTDKDKDKDKEKDTDEGADESKDKKEQKEVDLIRKGDSLILDAGSSATEVAKVIFKERRNFLLSILTHNMEVFNKFALQSDDSAAGKTAERSRNQLILTGGAFDRNLNALYGTQTDDSIKKFYPRVVILAVSGLICEDMPESDDGFYCHDTAELATKKTLFTKSTHHRIIICDWSKIGKPDSFLFGETKYLLSGVRGKAVIVTTKPPKDASNEDKNTYKQTFKNLKKMELLNPNRFQIHELSVEEQD